MTRMIAVISGKGGVGKTTLAINIGAALAAAGKDVTLLDGNLTSPNVGIYLGAAEAPATLHDVLAGKKQLNEATYAHASGLKVIPGSIKLDSLDKMDLKQLKKVSKRLRGSCESVIIDLGSGFTSENSAVLSMADEALIVTNPELPAVTEALKAIKNAEEQNILVLGVILNKVDPENNEMSVKNVETLLGKPILAAVSESKAVKKAQAMKQPLVYIEPNSLESLEINKIAERLK